MNTLTKFISASSLAIIASTQLHAQAPEKEGWETSIGVAAIYKPSYLGDDSYQLSLRPDLRINYGDSFFASVATGIGYNVINTQNWKAGPIVKFHFGREEDGDQTFNILGDDTDDLEGLGDVDETIELGIFAEYTYEQYRARIELRQGLNGHEGLIGLAELKYSGSFKLFQKNAFYSIGPRILFGNSNYNGAFFDVNTSQSVASGLSESDTDGGINSYGLHATVAVPLTDSFGFFTRH